MFTYRLSQPLFFVMLALLPLWSGCSDTVIDPFDNDERYFTVYGHLDLLQTEHKLRVIPITRFAESINSTTAFQASIDAEVYTTDLFTGVRTQWTHKLEPLNDGSYGHVYTGKFLVGANRTYRLEVIRSDGKMATAETHVPVINTPTLFELGPEVFENDSTLVYRDIKIPEIASPWNIRAIYLWGSGPINRRIFVPYGRPGHRTDDGGWEMRMNISDDQQAVRDNVQWSIDRGQIPNADTYSLTAMGIQIRILDKNWDPPGGVFDPEILAQPGAMSNVENGYGFFGSVGLYVEEWNATHISKLLGHPF